MRPSRSRRTPPGRAALPSLLPLARAAAACEFARIRYRSAEGETTDRDVAVVGLGWRRDGWIFSAYCQLSASYRLFRVDRVLSVEPTDRPAPPVPPRFAPRSFAGSDLLDPPSAPTRLVSVRLAASAAPLAKVLFPFALVEPSLYVPPSQLPLFAAEVVPSYGDPEPAPQLELGIPSSSPRPVICHFRTTSLDHSAALVLSLGDIASPAGPDDFIRLVALMSRATHEVG